MSNQETRSARFTCGLLMAMLCALGCSDRIEAPPLDPEQAAAQAVANFDRNGDGYLDAKELAACPALRTRLAALDTDGDGRLSAAEIAARLTAYRDSRIGLIDAVCEFRLNGRPLANAQVTAEPEAFLGEGWPSATLTTDERGVGLLRVAGANVAGCPCGFYRLRVSRKDAAGKETIPARYNEQTTLGLEVGPESRGGPAPFRLLSK